MLTSPQMSRTSSSLPSSASSFDSASSSSVVAVNSHSTVPFPSSSLCPDSAANQQLLESAGLWPHYLDSIAALTRSFHLFTQRTLAAYKQLSERTPVDSTDLHNTLSALNVRYVDAHHAVLAAYTNHIQTSADSGTSTATRPTQSTQSRARVKAVRSLTTKQAASAKQRPAKDGRRTFFSAASTSALRVWFKGHLRAPYPSEKQKRRLSEASGMSVEQVANWYAPHTAWHKTHFTTRVQLIGAARLTHLSMRCVLLRFVNARMRLWRKYIVEERETAAAEQEADSTGEKPVESNTQPSSNGATRDERMKKRALKRRAEEQPQTDTLADERQPRKKRSAQVSLTPSQQPVAQPTTTATASPFASQLPSPALAHRPVVFLAPMASMEATSSSHATLFSTDASPAQWPRYRASLSTLSALASPSLLSPTATLQLSSTTALNLSSEPPCIASAGTSTRGATAFDFALPSMLSMSMTLPNTVRLPAVVEGADVADAVDAGEPQQHNARRGSMSSVFMSSPPLSSQLFGRSLRWTFTATQWAALAQFTPELALDS